jgi:hypothetical protein
MSITDCSLFPLVLIAWVQRMITVFCKNSVSVLRIHDILAWIRIRRSMPLTNGPDSDPDPDAAIFVTDLQDAKRKLILKINFFCLLLFEGTFT